MTQKDREIWRGAFDLYENNHAMPNNMLSWQAFLRAVCAFADRYDWKNCPLAHFLADAVIFACEAEVKERESRQLTLEDLEVPPL